MATYSKETALYDTGAIGTGIAGAESNGKKEATNYIYAGSDGIKIANADPEHADTYQKQTAESTEFYVDGVKRNSVSGDGMKVYADNGSTEVARFSNNAVIGTEDAYRTTIEEDSFSIKDADVNLFSVSPSGSPTTESFSTTYNQNDHADSEHPLNVTLPYTPVAGSTIKIKTIIARGGSQIGKDYTLTAGTSRTITDGGPGYLPAWQIQYTSPKSFTFSFPDSPSTSPSAILEPYAIEYTAPASDPVDLGIFSFGTRSSASSNGNNSATLGLDLQAMYNYQTVVGKHNNAYDGPFIVGNGSSETPGNALTVDWDGTIRTHKNSMKTLLTTASYMGANQDLTFSEPVSEQLTGIVLVWSFWSGSQAEDWGWRTFFIPKAMVQLHNGVGYDCPLSRPKSSYFGHKYVYIHDTHITGHADNVATGTANNVPYKNNKWVLRYVFGC